VDPIEDRERRVAWRIAVAMTSPASKSERYSYTEVPKSARRATIAIIAIISGAIAWWLSWPLIKGCAKLDIASDGHDICPLCGVPWKKGKGEKVKFMHI
jgi:hypothetical protein